MWKYEDLWEYIKNPPFEIEMNSHMISEKLFIVALDRILWNTDENLIEPIITNKLKGSNILNSFITLFDPDEKKILINENYHVVTMVHDDVNKDVYYIMTKIGVPIHNQQNIPYPTLDIESCYRYDNESQVQSRGIKIRDILNDNYLDSFEKKKKLFIDKWSNVSVEKLFNSICDFDIEFHEKFIEFCVENIFNLLTAEIPTDKKKLAHISEKLYKFYTKMIYYYDIKGVILWASTSKTFISEKYDKFAIFNKNITAANIETADDTVEDDMVEDGMVESLIKSIGNSSSGEINMMTSKLNSSRESWAPSDIRNKFNKNVDALVKIIKNRLKKHIKSKLPASILPIGHILGKVPRFYSKKTGWFVSIEYSGMVKDIKENNIIVGYDEKLKNMMRTRFKLRAPIQVSKLEVDSRKIMKGVVCHNAKSKAYLLDVCKKLKIRTNGNIGIKDICKKIRTRLIRNDLIAKINGTNVRWFYLSYERQPV